MWVQLVAEKVIGGEKYRPGDWADVDERTARRWLAQAEISVPPDRVQALLPEGSGIVASELTEDVQLLAKRFKLGLEKGPPRLAFDRTLVWDTSVPLRYEMLPVGFGLLETWQLAAPLRDYDTLALDLGTREERERTRGVLHDLRVMVYEPGVLFMQNCEETRLLMRRWEEEGRGDLAFLRALYQAKPVTLALPSSWIQKE